MDISVERELEKLLGSPWNRQNAKCITNSACGTPAYVEATSTRFGFPCAISLPMER
jgi:hypothetical protein